MKRKFNKMKISDKLKKVNDNFNVEMYDNGFMLSISGRDDDDEYKSVKIVASNLIELLPLVEEAAKMPRDN